MEQVLEHDPGHIRTREHYEAMVRELQREGNSGAATAKNAVAAPTSAGKVISSKRS